MVNETKFIIITLDINSVLDCTFSPLDIGKVFAVV